MVGLTGFTFIPSGCGLIRTVVAIVINVGIGQNGSEWRAVLHYFSRQDRCNTAEQVDYVCRCIPLGGREKSYQVSHLEPSSMRGLV